MKILSKISIILFCILASKYTIAQNHLLQFKSNIIYQYIGIPFQIEFPHHDTSKYIVFSNEGEIQKEDTNYFFTTTHLGNCKIYLKHIKKKKIADSVELVCKELPKLFSLFGTVASGKIAPGELFIQKIIWAGFGPHDRECWYYKLKTEVVSYTAYFLNRDTFYKYNLNSRKIILPKDQLIGGDIIIIDNIKSRLVGYNIYLNSPPIILTVSSSSENKHSFESNSCKLIDDKKYDFDFNDSGLYFHLQKKILDSGFIFQLRSSDSSHKLIFEDKSINGHSDFKFCPREKYIKPEELDTNEIIDFINWDLMTQWDSSEFGKHNGEKTLEENIGNFGNAFFNERDSNDIWQYQKTLRDFFSKEECEYLRNVNRNPYWSDNFIPKSIKLIPNPRDTVKNEDYYDIGHPTVNHYIRPLITKDKKFAIVYKSYSCGMLCAGGCCYIYKKNGPNKWELYKKFNCWVS